MSADWMAYVLPSLFSFSFVLVYVRIFRLIKKAPRTIEMLTGSIPISITAVILESYLFNYLGTLLGLLVAAPVLEEALKFAGTARKRDVSSGLGVGLGFAFTENLLYFHAFLSGYSISSIVSVSFISSQVFLFVAMRGSFDPLLHATLTGLSVRTWQKDKRFWLPIAIGFHVAYNFVAVLGMTNIPFLVAADVAVLGPALFLLLRKARTSIQTVSPKITTESKQRTDKVKPQVQVDVRKLGIDNLAAWVRASSRAIGFQGITKAIGLELSDRYERTMWIRRSLTVSNGRKITYTEIGPYGALLVTALAALGGIAVWVLFL
ncbi:MAG: PrsW family intramembrane metalloprotease [Thermoplasmatales archaeon]|nr:PrsW family intramembrane metalloprotease [Thermoplasmatales archaeon]